MMRITRRMIFSMALGLAGTVAGLAMAAPYERCRARCTERSWAGRVKCAWAGPVRNDIASAFSDAARHQNLAEHVVTIEHFPAYRGGTAAEDFPSARDEPMGAAIDRDHGIANLQKANSPPIGVTQP